MHRTNSIRIFLLSSIFVLVTAGWALGQMNMSGAVDAVRCWAYPTKDLAAESLGAYAGQAYIGYPGAKIEAVGVDGKRLWSTELGGDITSNLLAHGGGVFLITSASIEEGSGPNPGTLRSLSVETGLTTWAKPVGEAERHYLHLFNGWVVVVSTNGSILALDAATGSTVWKREIASGFSGRPDFGERSLNVVSTSNQLFTIALASGEIEMMRKLPFLAKAVAVMPSGETVAGDERGNITAHVNGGEKWLWRFKGGGEISVLLEVGPNLLAASHDNFVYFLSGRNGNVLWKRRLAGRALYVTELSDRHGLLSSSEDNGAVIVDLDNGKVVGSITFDEDEALSATPVISSGSLLAVTRRGLYSYSLSGCPANKESGPAK